MSKDPEEFTLPLISIFSLSKKTEYVVVFVFANIVCSILPFSSNTRCNVDWCIVLPIPKFPKSFQPQEKIAPSLSRKNNEWFCPADINVIPVI